MGSENFIVDAAYDREEFALSYERNRCSVTWSRFQQKKCLFHMKSQAITQVVGDYLITITKGSNLISFRALSEIERGFQEGNEDFTFILPKSFNETSICFFLPIVNESKTYLALGLCYGHSEGWLEDKYQGLIVLDTER